MNLIARKLLILKNSIEEKENIAKKLGHSICTSDLKLKNNVNSLLNKLKTVQ